MSSCTIYRLLNTRNGRYYIGSSSNVQQRFHVHMHALRRGTHTCAALQADWNAQGGRGFMFSVLYGCPASERYRLEQAELDAADKHLLYNTLYWAGVGTPPGPLNPNFGRKQTPEHIAKQRAAQAGKPRTHPRGYSGRPAPVRVQGKQYASLREAAQELGMTYSTLRSRVRRGVAGYAYVKPAA